MRAPVAAKSALVNVDDSRSSVHGNFRHCSQIGLVGKISRKIPRPSARVSGLPQPDFSDGHFHNLLCSRRMLKMFQAKFHRILLGCMCQFIHEALHREAVVGTLCEVGILSPMIFLGAYPPSSIISGS